VAHLSDGSTASAETRTSALRIDQVEQVALVNLYPVVMAKDGSYVANLQGSDFRILENGRPEAIERFSTERKPMRVALVLDASASMERGSKLEQAKAAALEFLELLEPHDEAVVITFNDRVSVAQDLTSDRAKRTALYDAIYRAADKLRGFDGRRVVVLLSDGKDEARDGLEPGSLHTLEEALAQALLADVMVFAIGSGSRLENECVFSYVPLTPDVAVCPDGTVADVLRRVAGTTGGQAIISAGVGKLRRAFQGVAETLRAQYSLAYVSDDPSRDGKFREVRVTVPGRDVEVVVRRGYYARKS
jgi:Ca-activated chloride channel family protein